MEKYQFKTNINCGGCLAKVSPFLDENSKITSWNVDTNDPKKILTVETEDLSADEVKAIVNRAGYNVEPI